MSRAIFALGIATCVVGALAAFVWGGEILARAAGPEPALLPVVGQNIPRIARELGKQPGKAKKVAARKARQTAEEEKMLEEAEGAALEEGAGAAPIEVTPKGEATPAPEQAPAEKAEPEEAAPEEAAEEAAPAEEVAPLAPTPKPYSREEVLAHEWRRQVAEARAEGTLHLLLANEAEFRKTVRANAVDYKPLRRREEMAEEDNEALWRATERSRPRSGYPYRP